MESENGGTEDREEVRIDGSERGRREEEEKDRRRNEARQRKPANRIEASLTMPMGLGGCSEQRSVALVAARVTP